MDGPKQTKVFAKGLRREMWLPEVLVWQNIRGGRLESARFRRQHPMGAYVLDFYCDETKLAVEIDGQQHTMDDHAGRDAVRDAWFAARGIETLRIPAIDVLTSLNGVLVTILATIRARRARGALGRRARTRL